MVLKVPQSIKGRSSDQTRHGGSIRVTKSMVNMEVALKFVIFSIVGGYLTCFQSEGAGIPRSFVVDLIAFYRVSHKSKPSQW